MMGKSNHKSFFVMIFESIFFHPSFQSLAPPAQSLRQLASGVNYCYLVVWGPIAGTHSLSRDIPRGFLLLTPLFRHTGAAKCSCALSHLVINAALCFALSEFSVVRAPISCFTVLRGAALCKGAQGFHHISLLIASFNLRQMRPKSLWRILYSSLLIINKNFKWGNIF